MEVAERWELARGLLQRAEERFAGVRAEPGAAAGRMLPVAEPLAGLFPGGGPRRGSTVAVPPGPGATSLLLALLVEASEAGAWIGVVGRPELGLVAAAEAGLRLERLALVPHPGGDLVAVTMALLDGLDVVAVAGRAGVRAADRRRLAARTRQRGVVLVPLRPWPGADAELTCSGLRWEGPDARVGRLRARRAEVRLRGRGVPPAGRSVELLLPGPGGGPVPVGHGAGGRGRRYGWSGRRHRAAEARSRRARRYRRATEGRSRRARRHRRAAEARSRSRRAGWRRRAVKCRSCLAGPCRHGAGGGVSAGAVRVLTLWAPDWPVTAAARAAGVPIHRPAAVVVANRVLAWRWSAGARPTSSPRWRWPSWTATRTSTAPSWSAC